MVSTMGEFSSSPDWVDQFYYIHYVKKNGEGGWDYQLGCRLPTSQWNANQGPKKGIFNKKEWKLKNMYQKMNQKISSSKITVINSNFRAKIFKQ